MGFGDHLDALATESIHHFLKVFRFLASPLDVPHRLPFAFLCAVFASASLRVQERLVQTCRDTFLAHPSGHSVIMVLGTYCLNKIITTTAAAAPPPTTTATTTMMMMMMMMMLMMVMTMIMLMMMRTKIFSQ